MASEAHLYQLDPPSVPYFGSDPCWAWGREGQHPATCKECHGEAVAGSSDDPLHSTLDPRTCRVLVWVCMACGRTHYRNPPGRVCEPNPDVLDALGDLKLRDTSDRTTEAVRLSKRAKAKGGRRPASLAS